MESNNQLGDELYLEYFELEGKALGKLEINCRGGLEIVKSGQNVHSRNSEYHQDICNHVCLQNMRCGISVSIHMKQVGARDFSQGKMRCLWE